MSATTTTTDTATRSARAKAGWEHRRERLRAQRVPVGPCVSVRMYQRDAEWLRYVQIAKSGPMALHQLIGAARQVWWVRGDGRWCPVAHPIGKSAAFFVDDLHHENERLERRRRWRAERQRQIEEAKKAAQVEGGPQV